jgi:hypothetical protein
MARAIPLRTDYTAGEVRRFAKYAKDAAQARRLLAIAAVLDGASREDAAKIGGMDRQTLRDWVIRFNEQGRMVSPTYPRRARAQARRHAQSPFSLSRQDRVGGPDPCGPRCGSLAGVRSDNAAHCEEFALSVYRLQCGGINLDRNPNRRRSITISINSGLPARAAAPGASPDGPPTSTITGAKTTPLSPAPSRAHRASRRHPNNCWGVKPSRRATADTVSPLIRLANDPAPSAPRSNCGGAQSR